MGSKAEYEAKKAAKLAKRAAEEAAKRQAVIEGCVVREVTAPAGDDQEIRYQASLAAETAAYEAAGLAKLTPQVFMTKADPIGGALLSKIFPEHRETHIIGFCVTVEPPSVPMTMRHWPAASLDLGTGDQHRGYAQQQWPNRSDERCWRQRRPQSKDRPGTVCRVARTLATASAPDVLRGSQAAHPGGDRPRRRYRRDRCHPASRGPLLVSPD